MVETIAPIIALDTFAEEIRGKKIIIFVDSEVTEGTLIKGDGQQQKGVWAHDVLVNPAVLS